MGQEYHLKKNLLSEGPSFDSARVVGANRTLENFKEKSHYHSLDIDLPSI
jgi:hypothetical protein